MSTSTVATAGEHPGPDNPFLRKLSYVYRVSDEECHALLALLREDKAFAAEQQVLTEGQRYPRLYVVKSGWAMAYKLTVDGDRQITSFLLPGDVMCPNATVLGVADHYVETLTEVVVYVVDGTALHDLTTRHPRLGMALIWCELQAQQALLAEHLVNVGQRSAEERVAHLIVELWRRLQILGRADEPTIPLPLSQAVIGDSLALSPTHVSRTLGELADKKLIEVHYRAPRSLTILDPKGLEVLAGFDDGYLHLWEQYGRRAAVDDD